MGRRGRRRTRGGRRRRRRPARRRHVRGCVGARASQKTAPASAPTTHAADITVVISRSRLRPASRCTASPINDVAVMIARDVPTAVRIVKASAIASVGTIRKPPPTPKKPVRKPTSTPARRSRGSRSGGQLPPVSQVPSAGSSLSALRQVAAAAASMTSANAPSSAVPLTASLARVPATRPGTAASVNEPAWRQHTRPAQTAIGRRPI